MCHAIVFVFYLARCSSASLSLQNQYGNTLLMVAAEEGNEEACNAFLDGGASLRDTDIHGRNVIHVAANKNSANLLKVIYSINDNMTRFRMTDNTQISLEGLTIKTQLSASL